MARGWLASKAARVVVVGVLPPLRFGELVVVVLLLLGVGGPVALVVVVGGARCWLPVSLLPEVRGSVGLVVGAVCWVPVDVLVVSGGCEQRREGAPRRTRGWRGCGETSVAAEVSCDLGGRCGRGVLQDRGQVRGHVVGPLAACRQLHRDGRGRGNAGVGSYRRQER